MEAIREQQEKLARLHFEVGAEQVFCLFLLDTLFTGYVLFFQIHVYRKNFCKSISQLI